MIDLKLFCASENDIRSYLAKPMEIDGFLYATNGHIAIRVKGKAEEYIEVPASTSEQLIKIFANCEEYKYRALPEISEPKKYDCGICKGTGKVTICDECAGEGYVDLGNNYNAYEVECRSCMGNGCGAGGEKACEYCDGDGYKYKRDGYAQIGNTGLNYKYFQLIKSLPSPEICLDIEKHKFIPFRFDGGYGALMPMRY